MLDRHAVDFYDAVVGLVERQRANYQGTLELYLRALLTLLNDEQESVPTCELLLRLLEQAFSAKAVAFDPAWDALVALPDQDGSFESAHDTLLFLIADLHRLHEDIERTADKHLTGLWSAVTQWHWYNFDPFNFLERGAAGVRKSRDRLSGEDAACDWDTLAHLLTMGSCYE